MAILVLGIADDKLRSGRTCLLSERNRNDQRGCDAAVGIGAIALIAGLVLVGKYLYAYTAWRHLCHVRWKYGAGWLLLNGEFPFGNIYIILPFV